MFLCGASIGKLLSTRPLCPPRRAASASPSNSSGAREELTAPPTKRQRLEHACGSLGSGVVVEQPPVSMGVPMLEPSSSSPVGAASATAHLLPVGTQQQEVETLLSEELREVSGVPDEAASASTNRSTRLRELPDLLQVQSGDEDDVEEEEAEVFASGDSVRSSLRSAGEYY